MNGILRELEQKLKQRNEFDQLLTIMFKYFDGMKLPPEVEKQMDFYRRKYDGILNRIDEIPG